MKSIVLSVVVALGLAGPAVAQSPAPQAPPAGKSTTPGNMGAGDNANPAIKSPQANSDQRQAKGGAALEAGANSFTESQARSRIEGAGFGQVTGLAKDAQGIWRGKAQKDGRMVSVGLDYKGNIASE